MKKNRQQILNNKKRKQGEAVRNREKEIKQSASIRQRLKEEADERAASQRYYRRQREMIQSLSRLDRDIDINLLGMMAGTAVGLNRFINPSREPIEENRRLNDPNTLDLGSNDYKEV